MSVPEARDSRAADRLGDETACRLYDEEVRWLDAVAQSMPLVRSYIRRVSTEEAEIADLAAETRCLAWLGRAELLADPSPNNIMIRHARKACREWVSIRRREISIDEIPVAAEPSRENGEVALSVEEAEAWRRWSVHALSCLSTHQRLAVDYRYRWCWAYEFVAAAIGSTKSTARVHAHRGLGRLRTIVANHPPPTPESD